MMKKGFIIPSVLFLAVFCVSFFCQRYSLIFREYIGLFLFTPDWLRETFTGSWPLSNFVASFLGQFYAEPVVGPMIPAAVTTVIYLCLSAVLRKCRAPFHRLLALAAALSAWCFTASLSTSVAIAAVLLISVLLWLITLIIPVFRGEAAPNVKVWEFLACGALIVGATLFVVFDKTTRENEELAKVIVSADRYDWAGVLKVATPERAKERPTLMPFAMLALNGQVKLSEAIFRYPVTGIETLDTSNEKNALSDLHQSYLYEIMDVPNEAIHQMFQFSTNFNHGMTHISLRRLIRLNIDAGQYNMAVKYATILRHNLFYRPQCSRIIAKYGSMENLCDSTQVASSSALVLTDDPTSNIMQLVKSGNNSPVVMERLLVYLLLERNLDDFQTLFYSYDWAGKRVPLHYQEALLLCGNIRHDVTIDQFLSRNPESNAYRKYYFAKKK